jgi:hypothetical protein
MDPVAEFARAISRPDLGQGRAVKHWREASPAISRGTIPISRPLAWIIEHGVPETPNEEGRHTLKRPGNRGRDIRSGWCTTGGIHVALPAAPMPRRFSMSEVPTSHVLAPAPNRLESLYSRPGGALSVPKSGTKWQCFGFFSSVCTPGVRGRVCNSDRLDSSSRMRHRRGIAAVIGEREGPGRATMHQRHAPAGSFLFSSLHTLSVRYNADSKFAAAREKLDRCPGRPMAYHRFRNSGLAQWVGGWDAHG